MIDSGRIRAAHLQSGMTIGIVLPSSPVREDAFERGIKRIEARGYNVRLGDHARDSHGYLAGSDTDRASDLNAMFANPDVKAVFCGRGGYGAFRILHLLDWDLIRANPKVFVGYSDITHLHLGLERRCNLVTIHGPVVTTIGGSLRESREELFWRMLESPEPSGLLDIGDSHVETLVGGKVVGRLAGGCLSILAASVGTADPPDFKGRIVLLEDIGEPVYRADRYVNQLRRSGLLGSAAGFVIGRLTGWEQCERESTVITPEDLWRDLIAPLGKPAIYNFPFGHEPNPLTLPLGCVAELDANSGSVTVLESATV